MAIMPRDGVNSKFSRYMTADEIMMGAVPCPAVVELIDDLRREARDQLIDPIALRRGQDWSYLSSRVFGAEGD